MTDLYREYYPPVGDGSDPMHEHDEAYAVWQEVREAVRLRYLVKVEPTDRICTVHHVELEGSTSAECWFYGWTNELTCKMVDVVRITE